MGLPAKKDDEQSEVVELSFSTDREQGLSQNFDDPILEDMIPGLVASGAEENSPSPLSVVEEAAAAVQELVQEAQPLHQETFDPDPTPHAEVSQLFGMEGNSVAEENAAARWEMAEKLFQLVSAELSFDDLVESSLSALLHGIGGQAGAVLEFDSGHNDYFFRSSIGGGDPEKVKAFRVPSNKGIVGHVGESRQSILLRDLAEDAMQMRAISLSVGFEAKTCMAAPLLIGAQLYGVVEVFNRKDGGCFEERDLQLLEDGIRMFSKVLEVRFLMAELLRRAG